eukprot:747392-Alexandrium_andersonii.AAC.1
MRARAELSPELPGTWNSPDARSPGARRSSPDSPKFFWNSLNIPWSPPDAIRNSPGALRSSPEFSGTFWGSQKLSGTFQSSPELPGCSPELSKALRSSTGLSGLSGTL